jgi:hypothetical protein
VQKPLWCTNYSTDSCNDREYYYLGELPYLSVEESLIYEVRIRYSEEIYMTSRLLRASAAIVLFFLVEHDSHTHTHTHIYIYAFCPCAHTQGLRYYGMEGWK